jgi:hypothetical protein
MFLISEGASIFLSAELGNGAGLLAAAVLMFFLEPLQRFADGVASTRQAEADWQARSLGLGAATTAATFGHARQDNR